MSTPRKGQSRPATGRPRKIAGRTDERAPASDVEDPVVEPLDERAPASDVETPAPAEPAPAEPSEPETRRRPRTTYVLVAVIAVLALVGVVELVYLTRDPSPTVSAARPIVTGEVSHRAAVEAAARSTEQILSTTYQDYDKQVDQATSKMTDTFAADYSKLAASLKDKYAQQQMKLTVKAVAQGVVQASPQQVQALLFLNQYVEKVQDGKPATAYSQYRALVTVVHTDQGWLVSDIKTQ